MRFFIRSWLNLFLQSPCPLCGRATDAAFCPNCQRRLEKDRFPNPAQFWSEQPRIFAWGAYSGALKRSIGHLKYDSQPDLAAPLGERLAHAWLTHPVSREISNLTIVPIPLHPDKHKQRGYNQAELIARHFCKVTGYPLQACGLQRIRSTEALFSLSPTQRSETLHQALAIGQDFQDRPPTHPVLLVDDIYTTGATVRAAIQTLNRYGIRVYGVIVVAKTMMGTTEKRI